ncbi:MAG: hypothetical protein ACO363_05505 [Balneolaceae bacterium]
MLQDKEPYEIVSTLLSSQDDDARNALIAELGQMAGEHREKVEEILASVWRQYRTVTMSAEQAEKRARHAYNTVSAQRKQTNRDRNYLHQLVADLPEADPIDFDGDEASHWYGVIARAGILAGYPTDVQRLLGDIAVNHGYASAQTAWETADETLTNNGEHPVPVSIEEAVAEAQAHSYGRGHPMRPQLHKFWAMVWDTAKSETSLCEVFDEMARALGLSDELRPLQSGWFIVSGTFSARVEGEHYAGETPDFDVDDVYSEIDRYSIEITDVEEDY